MKHIILFPTDFSVAAEKVFGHAVRLANKLEAELHILHVYHYQMPNIEIVPEPIRDSVKIESEESAQKHMEHYAQELKTKTGHSIKLNTIFKTGFAVDEIPMVAAEIGATIIVMGATGASGSFNEVVGTVATGVIERAACPVLAVPPEHADKEVWRMSFASSFREEEGGFFSKVEKLGRDMGMHLTVVHVEQDKPAEAFEENDRFFNEKRRAGEIEYLKMQHKVPADGLKVYLENHQVDILALHPRKRSFWQNLFQDSLTKKILLSHRVNVLAITDAAAENMYNNH